MSTSVERRRRWSRDEKERLVAACLEPNASVSEIAARRASMPVSCSVGAKSSARSPRHRCRSS
ncbi:transposase [Mesorhizobium sp. M0204]|uniref:transposase n=1 Tax=Mesorhizobium sp. M0204 TaxID=2956913 RepID=UPI00333BF80F